jgi:hypothetical protein
MKTFLTMTLAVVTGVALTTTITLARLRTPLQLAYPMLDLPAESDRQPPLETAVPKAEESGAKPLAVVEQEEFDFGHKRDKTMDNRHVFTVRNDGDAPLVFTGSTVSCTKCTFVDLPKEPIAPGQTAEVTVRWNVDTFEDHFRQSATVKTNDPEHESIRFVISGKVVRPLQLEPQKLVFSNLQVSEPAQAKVRLTAYFSDHLEIVSPSFADASTAEFFDMEILPVPKDELDAEAQSGLDLIVKVKPGLPVGSMSQTLKFTTNLPDEPETTIPISGDVVGAVTVSGKGWDRESGYLQLGQVRQSEGAKRTVYVIAHGTDLTGLKLDPPEVAESALRVTYGKIAELKEGTVIRLPVHIEVPAGSPLVNHMGGKQARLAEIVIATNKPTLGRVKISVKFAVIAD